MISDIKKQIEKNKIKIDEWFSDKWRGLSVPLYASVDLRNAHTKIAVVDTNAFPAGFNNLCPYYCEELTAAFKDYLNEFYPGAKTIMLAPENHTRNKFYLENVRRIKAALKLAGYDVVIGSLDPELRDENITLETVEGELLIHKVTRVGNTLSTKNAKPDLIISNNDFSESEPKLLNDLDVPVIPSPKLGWHTRRKHRHFEILNSLIDDFAKVSGIDPWCLSTSVSVEKDIDFNEESSRKRLAAAVDSMIEKIKSDYDTHSIDEVPRVFVKNNAGTYGIAVMTVKSGDEIINAARKTRVKMKTGKGKVKVNEVMIQEGVPTQDMHEGNPMEPVIYIVGDRPIGGFFRLHRERTFVQNLNVRGMEFRRLCFHQVSEQHPEKLDDRCEDSASLMLVYGTMARLASLALGIEMKEITEDE
jgi:glutamate--cysteine ligase